jgi:tetratricopeptide (TPR) repeat protein
MRSTAVSEAYALAGRLADGIPLLERAVQQSATTGIDHHSFFMSRLSEAYLMEGRTKEATAVAEQALALSRECSEHGIEAWVLRVLGEIAARRNPPDADTAERHYRTALTLASERGMRPLIAHCRLGFGALCRSLGKEEHAREHLTTAAAMYHEMDMRFYLDQAAALSAPM